jgi:4-carboxymuconolactone decarboxylase
MLKMMKTTKSTVLALTALAVIATASVYAQSGTPQTPKEIMVSPGAARAAQPGPTKTFTGKVTVKPLFNARAPGRTGGAEVTFPPKARTFWHTHPLGQTLVVTKGTGWVGRWNGPVQVMKEGDVVQIPANTKHWHGGTTETSVTHIAIQENAKDGPVTWLEAVSEDQYAKGPSLTSKE